MCCTVVELQCSCNQISYPSREVSSAGTASCVMSHDVALVYQKG
jgi:hypothetical protein